MLLVVHVHVHDWIRVPFRLRFRYASNRHQRVVEKIRHAHFRNVRRKPADVYSSRVPRRLRFFEDVTGDFLRSDVRVHIIRIVPVVVVVRIYV